jgi:dienelactone hydrolase
VARLRSPPRRRNMGLLVAPRLSLHPMIEIRRAARTPCALALAAACGACASVGASVPNAASLAGDGSFAVFTYTDFPDVSEFGDATIYYPVGTPGPIGGVAIAPGFTERQSHIEWWGPRLASHGYAVLVLDTNDPRERPDARAAALLAAVDLLRRENTRMGSRLFGRIAVDRMAVMGHSMGGGGALLAATRSGADLRAVIPFTSWEPDADFSSIVAPTLLIAGESDDIAEVGEHAWRHFTSIPASTPKVYMEVEGGDHFIADTNRGRDLATIGRYALAWLKLHLDGEEQYRDFLFGPRPDEDVRKLSRYITSP